ncbi:MAG: hypothetical protein QGF46_07920 [Planctomycetota bacterium]|nr:hypothetical protein [Planctomycetota bacterium]
MSFSEIEIKELRVANWQGVDVKIPNYCWTAISGPSGSGKTSLLFSGLDAWSAQQFELLRDPFAIVGPFEGQQIAASISSLLPVLASAGEIPRRRFGATIFNILNLHAVLDSTWKQFGEYKCSSCNENWRPDGSESALKKISQAAALNSKIHIVSSLAQQTKADVLLAQGLTRFFNGQELQRIEDQQDVVTAGGWLLHDRVKGVDGNETRLVEALLVAMARHERVAAFIVNTPHLIDRY